MIAKAQVHTQHSYFDRNTDVRQFLTTLAYKLRGKTADAQRAVLYAQYQRFINQVLGDPAYATSAVTINYLAKIFPSMETSLTNLVTWMYRETSAGRAITPALIQNASASPSMLSFSNDSGELFKNQVPKAWTDCLQQEFPVKNLERTGLFSRNTRSDAEVNIPKESEHKHNRSSG